MFTIKRNPCSPSTGIRTIAALRRLLASAQAGDAGVEPDEVLDLLNRAEV
jgi:hypothetical protein